MEANCGPSNALQALNKHSQRDNSLQRDIHGGHPQMNQPGFRSVREVDPRLNQEFQQFNDNGGFDERVVFQGIPGRLQGPAVGQGQQGWVQDFSNLSLQRDRSAIRPERHAEAKNDWHKQFIQQLQPQSQNANSFVAADHQRSQNMGFNYSNAHMMNPGAQNMMGSFMPNNNRTVTEHQEVHQVDQENEMFDSQFEEVEKELSVNTEVHQTEDDLSNEHEKNEFAKTARRVEESMLRNNGSSETASKFQNSEFLKLMNSIGNRSVELEGNKLVDRSNSEDAKQYLSDPLRGEREEVDYHVPPFGTPGTIPENRTLNSQSAPNNRPQVSHLPDPLAHIKEGDLPDGLGSLQTAQIVSGNQVSSEDWMEDQSWSSPPAAHPPKKRGLMPEAWQEVYDDYRHDDD